MHIILSNENVTKEILELFLSSGAKLESQNKDNKTSLHIYSRNKNFDPKIFYLIFNDFNENQHEIIDINGKNFLHELFFNEFVEKDFLINFVNSTKFDLNKLDHFGNCLLLYYSQLPSIDLGIIFQ